MGKLTEEASPMLPQNQHSKTEIVEEELSMSLFAPPGQLLSWLELGKVLAIVASAAHFSIAARLAAFTTALKTITSQTFGINEINNLPTILCELKILESDPRPLY